MERTGGEWKEKEKYTTTNHHHHHHVCNLCLGPHVFFYIRGLGFRDVAPGSSSKHDHLRFWKPFACPRRQHARLGAPHAGCGAVFTSTAAVRRGTITREDRPTAAFRSPCPGRPCRRAAHHLVLARYRVVAALGQCADGLLSRILAARLPPEKKAFSVLAKPWRIRSKNSGINSLAAKPVAAGFLLEGALCRCRCVPCASQRRK